MAQAQSFDAGNSSDLQNNKPVTAKRMKRMGDLSRAQRLTGSKCSSMSTLRDRVCMTAALLVLEPIFEADLPPERVTQEGELALRHLADSCFLLVDRQLQLAHEFAQAPQGLFGLARPAQDHEITR